MKEVQHAKNMITLAPRRDFESCFIKDNPILRLNEMVIVYDDIIKSGRIDESMYGAYAMYKRGDGMTPFNELPYISAYEAINNGWLYERGSNLPSARICLAYNIHKEIDGGHSDGE